MKKYFLFLLGTIVLGFIVWYFNTIFIYIIIAGILSLIAQPVDKFYSKFKIGNLKFSPTLSAAFAFLTLFSVFFLFAIIFLPLISEEANIISSLDRETVILSLQKPIESIEQTLRNFHIDFEGGNLKLYLHDKLTSVLTFTNLSIFFNQIISSLGNFFVALFAVSFLTFFFLRDEKQIINAILSTVPEIYSEKTKRVLIEAQHMLKRYFIGILTEVLLVITFLSIGLWIAGIKHALLIALFAGLVNVIPYIGPLIGTAFGLFIGLTTNADMTLLSVIIKILIVFPAVHLADVLLLQPLIYSNSVKAHPLEIFLAILVGATIGGIGGMILAVPAYTIIRVIAKEFLASFRIVKRFTDKLNEEK